MSNASAFRAARSGVGLSQKGLAAAAGVSVRAVAAADHGRLVDAGSLGRIESALRRHGVSLRLGSGPTLVAFNLQPVAMVKQEAASALAGLPYVSVRGPRADGTFRVLFEVRKSLRPKRWPCATSLPFAEPRRGDLADPDEVSRIQQDAALLLAQLHTARAAEPKVRRRRRR